ncbi:MAG: hypothetical protein D6719_10650 [Candidatus Dadabacteria bacterium]|nr:MAG: hypothetical protein D6719_10650 [Candidatus Dadabacteria bacterium]
MKKLLLQIFKELDGEIELMNSERLKADLPALPHFEIKLLGQLGLFADDSLPNDIILSATRDFDALLKGDWSIIAALKNILQRHGLVYDELSSEIWMPPDTQYKPVYQSDYIKCESPKAIYTLVSKAIKAPEKNRSLIVDALTVYGEELLTLISKHGGKPEHII